MKNRCLKNIIMLLIVTLIPVGLLIVSQKNVSKIETQKIDYKEGTNNNKFHVVNNGQTDYPASTWDKPETPYLMRVGEETYFYVQYTNQQEYYEAKNSIELVTYENNGLLTKVFNDLWDDGQLRLVFSMRANSEGECRIAIRNRGQQNNDIETVYVRILNQDKIYIDDTENNKYTNNPRNVELTPGQSIKVVSLMNGPLNMNGNEPSTAFFWGSGYWSWESITINNEWTKLDNNKWLLKTTLTPPSEGEYNIGLAKNGTAEMDTIKLYSANNLIQVDNVKIGNTNYGSVNKGLATRMTNGVDTGRNSSNNRYKVYIGEDLNLSATDVPGYTFGTNGDKLNEISINNEGGKLTAKYRGINVGTEEVLLKNANGDVVETLYIDVIYPIYVNTTIGETKKDEIHEYIIGSNPADEIQNPREYLTDTGEKKLYFKNKNTYWQSYWLRPDDTVVLSSYVKKDEDTDFILSDGLEVVEGENTYVKELSGDKADYKKISKEIKVTATSGIKSVRIGNENFWIMVISSNQLVQHLDIETEDGGTYTHTLTSKFANGKKIVTETVYSVSVSEIYGSKAYDAEENVIAEIQQGAYWRTHYPPTTQFESTSAYVTDGNGHLIKDGVIIDDEVRNGTVLPWVVGGRDIPMANIDHVEFDVDLELNPIKKVTTTITPDGNKNVKEEDISKIEKSTRSHEKIRFEYRSMIDALNKCPQHSGLDFTAKITLVEETNIINPDTMSNLIAIILLVLIPFGLIIYNRKNSRNNKKIKEL